MQCFVGVICPICKAEFFPTPEWVYKNGNKRFCSYNCLNKSREKKHRKGCKCVEQYSLEGKFIREFDSANQAAEFTGSSAETIRLACRGRNEGEALNFIWRYKNAALNETERNITEGID